MDYISWSENLSVGVSQFDEEHQQLVSFVNDLNNALKIGAASKTMESILVHLVKYTVIHFNNEEHLMKLHNYPDFDNHKKAHDELTFQVNDFYSRLQSGKASFSLELLTFLKDWLTKHILGSDMAYKEFFSAKGVK